MTRRTTGQRPHGTRNRYMIGAAGSDPANGCRCEPCTAANTIYQKRRRGGAYIDPTPVAEHLEFLSRNGIGKRTVAAIADIDQSTVYRIRRGGKLIRRDTAERILRIHVLAARAHTRHVPAERTHRLIDGLVAAGWTRTGIAKALGYRSPALQLNHPTITTVNAAKVDAFVRRVAPGVWVQVDDDIAAARHACDAHDDAVEQRRIHEAARYQRSRAARSDAA